MAIETTSASARAFAQASLELADADGVPDVLGDELKELAQMLKGDAQLREFFASPIIAAKAQAQAMQNALGEGATQVLRNLVGVLAERRGVNAIPQISRAYQALLDVRYGRVNVTVTVASPLDEEQLNRVRDGVSQALGKTAVLEQKVDESIIGGMVLLVEDKLIDASVKAQLQQMKQRLLAAGQ